VIRRLLLIAGATIAFWIVTAVPASRMGAPNALALSAAAATLCFVPTALVIIWAYWARQKSGGENVLMVMGGMGLRMTTVLVGAWLLTEQVAGIGSLKQLAPWLVAFYLFCLAIEIALVLADQKTPVVRTSR
jgi:hypothetical protein